MSGYLPGLGPLWRTAVVDPPWPERGGGGRGAQEHYPLAEVEEMPGLIEGSGLWLPYPDAHLYLWATTTHLPDALTLMGELGFEYRNVVVWAKSTIGLGQYFRGQVELLLFGVRGRGRSPEVCTLRKDVSNLLLVDHERDARGRRIHSAKPQASYELVEARSAGPYAEFFCRGAGRLGWRVWGNEATPSEEGAPRPAGGREGSMSPLEEKLAEPELAPSPCARRPLDSLRCCRGYQVLAGTTDRPDRVQVCPMDTPSVWARVPGLRGMYELVDTRGGR